MICFVVFSPMYYPKDVKSFAEQMYLNGSRLLITDIENNVVCSTKDFTTLNTTNGLACSRVDFNPRYVIFHKFLTEDILVLDSTTNKVSKFDENKLKDIKCIVISLKFLAVNKLCANEKQPTSRSQHCKQGSKNEGDFWLVWEFRYLEKVALRNFGSSVFEKFYAEGYHKALNQHFQKFDMQKLFQLYHSGNYGGTWEMIAEKIYSVDWWVICLFWFLIFITTCWTVSVFDAKNLNLLKCKANDFCLREDNSIIYVQCYKEPAKCIHQYF